MITEEKPENHEDIMFVYMVYGVVPEFMPHLAFRRDKHFKASGKKLIKCPHCGGVFITIELNEKVELYCHSKKAKIKWDNSIPCRNCNKMVGVIYASA